MNSAAHQEVAYQVTINVTITLTALMEVTRRDVAVAMKLKAVSPISQAFTEVNAIVFW